MSYIIYKTKVITHFFLFLFTYLQFLLCRKFRRFCGSFSNFAYPDDNEWSSGLQPSGQLVISVSRDFSSGMICMRSWSSGLWSTVTFGLCRMTGSGSGWCSSGFVVMRIADCLWWVWWSDVVCRWRSRRSRAISANIDNCVLWFSLTIPHVYTIRRIKRFHFIWCSCIKRE